MAEDTFKTPFKSRLKGYGKGLLFLALLACFAYGATILQANRLAQQIQLERPYIDSLFLPKTEYAKVLVFGYDMVAADFLYLRAIQAFGGQWKTGFQDLPSIFHFFYTVSELNPHFQPIYEFGSLVIGDEAKDYEDAIALNKKGWIDNRDKYRMPYLNAYMCYWNMKLPIRARFWSRVATLSADCPDYVRRFEFFFDRESGRYEAATEKWIGEYLRAIDNKDNYLLSIASSRMRDTIDEWNIDTLHRAVEKYRTDHQQPPTDIRQLVDDGYLNNVSVCDYFQLMSMLKAAEGYVGKASTLLEQIQKASFHQISGIPHPPFDPDPTKEYYFIRKDMDPKDQPTAIKNKLFIVSIHQARELVGTRMLPFLRKQIETFYKEHKRYPFSLEELFLTEPEGLRTKDPVTGTWNYNSATGKLTSPGFPDL